VAILKSEFTKFHKTIKLDQYSENKNLKEKRDLLVNELTNRLIDETVPDSDKKLTFTKFDQGSYAMNTGIKPKNDDYDIDVGIVFDITNDEYDSNKLKQLVFDKLDGQHNRTVEFNRPCITVKYLGGYHVDLVLYSDNDADFHIAWGKKNSKTNRCWYKAQPKKLTSWVKNVSNQDNESAQFRRSVRYLKKWKLKHFSSTGNETPPSIGLTIQTRNAFHDYSCYVEDNDLNALINVVKQIKNSFTTKFDLESMSSKKSVSIELPVSPYKDVYYKMTLKQLDNFSDKIDHLLEALENAIDENSAYEASKILQQVFGDDFPLAEDTKRSYVKPATVTGNNA
jgi:hypothetical protein